MESRHELTLMHYLADLTDPRLVGHLGRPLLGPGLWAKNGLGHGAVDAQDPISSCIRGLHGELLRGQALDGKTLRGASAHGELVHLLSLVRHESGVTLAQSQVAQKTNEITGTPPLLAEQDLRDTVTRRLAESAGHRSKLAAAVDQGGDFLTVIKQNQPDSWQAMDQLFRATRLDPADRRAYTYAEKGHGRLERRTLVSSTELNQYVRWLGAQQVLQRTCRRVNLQTSVVAEEVTYGLTSLSRERVTGKHLEQFWRWHWTIENRDHYVRDVTLGEDQCQVHTKSAAQALAALRNGVLTALRQPSWGSIAAALRHYGASVQKALALIGAGAT
jgi:predicted transposase YbfD/YdcC